MVNATLLWLHVCRLLPFVSNYPHIMTPIVTITRSKLFTCNSIKAYVDLDPLVCLILIY